MLFSIPIVRWRRDAGEWWAVRRASAFALAVAAAIGFGFSIALLLSRIAPATIVHTTKITANFPFTTRGHSTWGNAVSPTVECFGTQFNGGTTWPCTGATLTKTGTPSGGAATPFYFAGFSGTNATGVLLNGTGDYFAVNDPFGTLNSFRWCAAFRVNDATRTEIIATVDNAAAQGKWAIQNTAGRLDFTVYKSGGSSTVSSAAGALITGATHAACGSYDNSGGDGAAVLRLNTDGVAATAVTTGVSPPQAVANGVLTVGANAQGASLFSGVIEHLSITKGSVATAAQLLAFVLAYWGEVGDGEQQVSVTRATTETCQVNGANGTIYTMPNGVACVNENGIQAFAASTNLVIRGDELNNADWVAASGVPAVIAGAGASLYDTDTAGNVADSVEDADGAAAECIKAVTRCGTATGTYSASAYVKSMTGQTAATLRIVTDGTGTVSCETTGLSTSAYQRIVCSNKAITGAPTSNDLWICPGRFGTVADVAKILVFGVQCEALANVTPVIRTAGATAARNAVVPNGTGMQATLSEAQGSACATVTFPATFVVDPGINRLLAPDTGATTLLHMNTAASIGMYDGTTPSSTAVTSVVGRTARFCSLWSGGKMGAYEVGSTPTLSNYNGTWKNGNGILFGTGASVPMNGYIKDVRLCRAPGGCE